MRCLADSLALWNSIFFRIRGVLPRVFPPRDAKPKFRKSNFRDARGRGWREPRMERGTASHSFPPMRNDNFSRPGKLASLLTRGCNCDVISTGGENLG